MINNKINNWKDRFTKPAINKNFIVGKYYKLIDSYPLPNTMRDVEFNGRITFWNYEKIIGFKDGKCDKCIENIPIPDSEISKRNMMRATFENIESGWWDYHPEDFEEVRQ